MLKKIISKSEHEKKRKRNSLIVGLILIVVMLGSTFGIVINSLGGDSSPKSKIKYGEYEFLNENGFWKTSINGLELMFQYSPDQVREVNTSLKNSNNYYGKPLYVYSEDINSEIELYRNFQQIASRIQPACFNKENCTGDFPIKTCSDNFIIIREGAEEINQDENCIYINGEKENLLKLTDSFLYKLFNIK